MLDLEPAIVHFSGHGSREGLVLEDTDGKKHIVAPQAIENLFSLFSSHLECVILNACYSELQAIAIARYLPYVIGMNKAIGDPAAISYSRAFYSALGAGRTIQFAHEIGRNAIHLHALPDYLIPVLLKGPGVNEEGRSKDDIAAISYCVLKTASKIQVRQLLDHNKGLAREHPDDAMAYLNIGLLYLHLKIYAEAIKAFKKVICLSPETADAYYYHSLAESRGRRLKELQPEEIASVESHLSHAIAIDNEPAVYYYYYGILKYDYYFANSRPSHSPGYDQLFRQAYTKRRDSWEAERLLDIVPLVDEGLIELIRNNSRRD
jgi:tetratricopeptide (TPR) repeat protein